MLTADAVLALAPDDSSAKAARGLVAPAKWPTLGADDAAVWGECQGSGSKPYQTQVDLAGPTFRCSCPSRKFPCKHGLALLLLRAQDASRFATPRPAWVDEWLASRVEKAQKKEEREAQKAAAPPPDPAVAAKREAQRWGRIESAAQDLERWSADQLARGLGAIDSKALEAWHMMAARMVDAQAQGLGQRLLDAAEVVRRKGNHWPERCLHRLGLLQLACEALQRRASLAQPLQDELRTLAGWPIDKDDVQARGEAVQDRWAVIGVATDERDTKLVERRVWLHGMATGRRAFVLDHAFGGRGFEQQWVAGRSVDATLRFFPHASQLRALADDVRPAGEHAWPAAASLAQEWDRVTQRVAASPWVWMHPMVIDAAVPLRVGDNAWFVVAHGQRLPLAIDDAAAWMLLAASGGHALTCAGEWDGEAFAPLLAWHGAQRRAVWRSNAAQADQPAAIVAAANHGAWSSLLPVALVGTERHTGAAPAWPGDAGSVIANAMQGATQPAIGVLRAAGALAACNLAGTLGAPVSADDVVALPAAAAHDTLPELSAARLVSLATWTLERGPQRLAHDVLHALAEARVRLPAKMLVTALDASRRTVALRPVVTPVLGARGAWLAAQRDVWRHAAGVQTTDGAAADHTHWTDGNLDQRREFLRAERTRDAHGARIRLEAALPELPAPERADLAAVLAEGLSIDDEPLLDRLRADRSRDVRQVALRLLLRLPHAAHPQRAAQRVAALMGNERALLRKRWTIDAPAAAADDWTKDNVDADKPKHESLGERAWWLHQIARQVPLVWWTTHTGMAPADLLEWARKSDWADALQRAWFDVLLAAPDAAWAEAFCNEWPKAVRGHEMSPVMAMLHPAVREARWLRMVEGDNIASEQVLSQMVSACAPKPGDAGPAPRLSPAVSAALVTRMGRVLAQDQQVINTWSQRQWMPDIACILDAGALPALEVITATKTGDGPASVNDLTQTLSQIIAVRQAFASLSASTAASSSSTATEDD